MQTNKKDKPRSCSCQQCKRARKLFRKIEERAFRHRANQAVKTGENVTEHVTPAFSGERNG
jgi:hypothetical protein